MNIERNTMNRSGRGAIAFVLAGMLACTSAAAIDCTKALNPVESAICADAELVRLDKELNEAYSAALKRAPDPKKLRTDAASWIRKRNQIDPAKIEEIKTAYRTQITFLQKVAKSEDGLQRYASTDEAEMTKLERIRESIANQPLYLRNARGNAAPWCPAFLEQLRRGDPKIEVVEPVFRTEDRNDPRLRHYRTCTADGERRKYLERTSPDDPQANFWGIQDIGHRAFRLYRLPDPVASKPVEVVYAELNKGEGMSNQFPGYSIVNLETCSFEGGATVGSGMQFGVEFKGEPRKAYNLMVRYQGVFYVLEAYDMRGPDKSKPSYWASLLPMHFAAGQFCRWTGIP